MLVQFFAITDKDKQTSVAMKVFDEKLSVRETEKLVKHIVEPPKKTQKTVNTAEDAIYESLEEKMKGIMGTRVLSTERKIIKVKLKLNIIPEMNWKESLSCLNQ